jgi:hypothetical protein
MTTTQLEQLVHEVVTTSMRQRIARDVDSATEALTRDLLLEDEFRERMRQLLRRAFDRALGELSADA